MPKKLTTDEFIKSAKLIHGDKYDYSKVVYLGKDKQVEIICKKHGTFWQLANDHKRGHGCPECGKEEQLKKRTKDLKAFIKDSISLYGDVFDYSKVVYINNKTKVTLLCKICNTEFERRPDQHLTKKNNCPNCFKEKRAKLDFNIITCYNDQTDFRKEYIELIKKNKNKKNNGYTEKHHILPKSLFPNWADRKSNIIKLTPEEHYKAHYLLYKIYNNYETTMAFFLMLKLTDEKYNPQLYEEMRKKIIYKNGKRIYCYEKDKIYNTIAEAAKDNNLKSSANISIICSKNKIFNTANGFHFCYEESKEKNKIIWKELKWY